MRFRPQGGGLVDPFVSTIPTRSLLRKLPATVKSIAVLDRSKEPGANGESLLLDVQSAMYDAAIRPTIIGGRYGLGSKDVTPDQIVAVYDELLKPKRAKRNASPLGSRMM